MPLLLHQQDLDDVDELPPLQEAFVDGVGELGLDSLALSGQVALDLSRQIRKEIVASNGLQLFAPNSIGFFLFRQNLLGRSQGSWRDPSLSRRRVRRAKSSLDTGGD